MPSIEARLAAAGLPALPRLAWLEIDLAALSTNLGVLRQLAGPGVLVEPVVKADAYGHGAVPVAQTLEAAGADGFCVAAYDEAVELRRGGVRGPILVLYGAPPPLVRDAAHRRIALSLGDRRLVGPVLDAAAPVRTGPRLRVELEVETGLGRGGLEPRDLLRAAQAVSAAPRVALAGVWTHLQAPEDARRTAVQVGRFEGALADLRAAGIPTSRRHLVASGGLFAGIRPAFDAVRPGLAVYGIAPEDVVGTGPRADVGALRPALALKARPVRVADLPAGWGISYGPSFETARPSRIATLPLGYGDGWPRALSNRADALVRGVRAPIVGTVSMDAIMVDVTDIAGRPIDLDDEFVLIGSQGGERIDALELARRRGTISWEVVTAMAHRLPRVYDDSSGAVGLRTLTSPGTTWHASSSGTAISATSRSMRS